jgi:hypothetical protein
MWPHKRPEVHFTSHRLPLDKFATGEIMRKPVEVVKGRIFAGWAPKSPPRPCFMAQHWAWSSLARWERRLGDIHERHIIPKAREEEVPANYHFGHPFRSCQPVQLPSLMCVSVPPPHGCIMYPEGPSLPLPTTKSLSVLVGVCVFLYCLFSSFFKNPFWRLTSSTHDWLAAPLCWLCLVPQ